MHKKSKSVDNLIDRTRDRNNYLTYISNQARQMERERYNLKRLGISRNVDTEVFQSKCNEFVENIQKQCELVDTMTEGNIVIKPYILLEESNVRFYIDMILSNMVMSIFAGDKEIHKSPVNPIHIIASVSFRHLLNKQRCQVNFQGTYTGEGHFPYISSRRYNNYDNHTSFSAVCLDNYTDEVHNAFKRSDYTSMAMLLMQWSQYYSTKYSNPYNQPYMLHVGMPSDVSDEYYSQFDRYAVADSCSHNLNRQMNNMRLQPLDKLYYKKSRCEEINCQLESICNGSQINLSQIKLYEENFDIAEGIAGIIFEHCKGEEATHHEMSKVAERICGFWISTEEYGTNNDLSVEEYNNSFYQHMIKYISESINTDGNTYLYDWLVNVGILEKVEVKEKEVKSTEEMEAIMKHWAIDQEGA
jgi:hypothetical protein